MNKQCPICEDNLYMKKIRKTFLYRGVYFLVLNFPLLVCDSCEEEFINEKEMKPIVKIVKEKKIKNRFEIKGEW